MATTDLSIKDDRMMETFIPSLVYACSKCGKMAEIKNGIVIRNCEHEDASIIASVSATCKAKSGLK